MLYIQSCLSVCHRITAKEISRFHWKLMLHGWFGLPMGRMMNLCSWSSPGYGLWMTWQINHTACTSHKFLYLQQLHIKYKGMQLTTKLRQPAVLKHQKPQGDHSPDNVKLHDNSTTFPWRFVTLLPMLSVTHIMPILVLLSVVGVEMKQCTTQNQNEMHKLSNVKNGCKYAANNKQF